MSRPRLFLTLLPALIPRRCVPLPSLTLPVARCLHATHHPSSSDPEKNSTTVKKCPELARPRRTKTKISVTQKRAKKEKRERLFKIRQTVSAAKKAVRDEMLHANQDVYEETDDPNSFLGQIYTAEKVQEMTQKAREAGILTGAYGPDEKRRFFENFEAAGNASSTSSTAVIEPLKIPLSHWIQKEESELVFQNAPFAEAAATVGTVGGNSEERLEACKKKAELVSRIVSLSLESQRGIKLANISKALDVFGKSEGDTGSPEVQCAVMSVKIRHMQQHMLNNNRKDFATKRRLTMMMHKRRRVMKYLKNHSQNRYYDALHKIGLKEVHYI